MSEQKKVYGLIIPKKVDQDKKKLSASTSVFNVFGDDQDSDEDEKTKGPVGPYGLMKTNTKLKLQSQLDIEKAMKDDPTVYEYDDIYDDIQATKPQMGKETEVAKTKKRQKPLYIAGLLKAAEQKKKENERRNERKVQKERDAEGEKFADKESFVTSAYKQKMLDMEKEAEEERRKEAMEAMTDVTKQNDLGGFYRYLYHQKTGKEGEEIKVKEEPKEEVTVKTEPTDHITKEVRQRSSSSSDSEEKQRASHFKTRKNQEGSRMFRKRRADSSTGSDSENSSDEKHSKKDNCHSSNERDGKVRRQDDMILEDSRRERMNIRNEETKPRHRSSSSSMSRSKSRSPVDEGRKSLSQSKSNVENVKNTRHEDKVAHSKDRNRKQDQRIEYREKEGGDEESEDVGEISNGKPISENPPRSGKGKVVPKSVPVDPKEKVYPHHNSPADIEAARKRYLIRKLEREKNRGS